MSGSRARLVTTGTVFINGVRIGETTEICVGAKLLITANYVADDPGQNLALALMRSQESCYIYISLAGFEPELFTGLKLAGRGIVRQAGEVAEFELEACLTEESERPKAL